MTCVARPGSIFECVYLHTHVHTDVTTRVLTLTGDFTHVGMTAHTRVYLRECSQHALCQGDLRCPYRFAARSAYPPCQGGGPILQVKRRVDVRKSNPNKTRRVLYQLSGLVGNGVAYGKTTRDPVQGGSRADRFPAAAASFRARPSRSKPTWRISVGLHRRCSRGAPRHARTRPRNRRAGGAAPGGLERGKNDDI